MDKRTNPKPIKVGKFLKFSSDKTISVLTETRVTHPKYKKIIKRSKKYLVHFDSNIELNPGDSVEFMSCRPLSKLKSFTFIKKIER